MKPETSANNKRIAKNTLVLYIRMLFQMLISLYTSRVLLHALGVSDYGIYNVVGGIVAMFGFINATMTSATQRFLTFSLGKQNEVELKNVFSTAVRIHISIAVLLIILCETIGLWFLYNKMVIPDERMEAAFWVFQCSVITTAMLTICVPYNALIISHEKMSVFAYISIFTASVKLGIVYLIIYSNFNRLIYYAVLMMLTQLFVNLLYTQYCKAKFRETHGITKIHKPLLKEMSIYAGWNLWGTCAVILCSQGLNVLLNMFFGTVVNAARGVSVQVNTAVNQLSRNFLMAINPQITKTYASGDTSNMYSLIYRSSKFTFFLLYIISLPIILEADNILGLWLVEVPQYSAIFLRFILVISIFDGISTPLMQAVGSTGKIALYQTVLGGMLLLILPVSYVVLKMGYSPVSVYIVNICFSILSYLFRIIYVCSRIGLNFKIYWKVVVVKIVMVILISSPIPIYLHYVLESTFLNSFIVIASAVMISFIIISTFGLDKNERNFVSYKIRRVIHGKKD